MSEGGEGGGVIKFPIFPKLQKVHNILVKKIMDSFHILGHFLIGMLP